MTRPFEAVFVEQCAPTLAGVKPANLFRYEAEDKLRLCRAVFHWNRQLSAYGLSLRIVKGCARTNSFLIYLYRTAWLKEILSCPDNQAFLAGFGYPPTTNCRKLLQILSKRLCLSQGFPHEVGVFLGYPLCDVVGFIAHQGQNYTCSGYWKAYGNPAAAQKRFAQYKKCTSIYKKMFERGTPIIQLIVAA